MYNRQIKIRLACTEDHFRWNFDRYLKSKRGNTWFYPSDQKLAGFLKEDQIELWYNPRSYQKPYSLALARGSFKFIDEKVEIALEVYMEARYPQAYLSVGLIATIIVWILFGLVSSQGMGFAGLPPSRGIGFAGLEIAMLIFTPFLSLILSLVAFNNSVKDMEEDILKYMSLIERKPRRRRTISGRSRRRR